jgi:hypothetical protein
VSGHAPAERWEGARIKDGGEEVLDGVKGHLRYLSAASWDCVQLLVAQLLVADGKRGIVPT